MRIPVLALFVTLFATLAAAESPLLNYAKGHRHLKASNENPLEFFSGPSRGLEEGKKVPLIKQIAQIEKAQSFILGSIKAMEKAVKKAAIANDSKADIGLLQDDIRPLKEITELQKTLCEQVAQKKVQFSSSFYDEIQSVNDNLFHVMENLDSTIIDKYEETFSEKLNKRGEKTDEKFMLTEKIIHSLPHNFPEETKAVATDEDIEHIGNLVILWHVDNAFRRMEIMETTIKGIAKFYAQKYKKIDPENQPKDPKKAAKKLKKESALASKALEEFKALQAELLSSEGITWDILEEIEQKTYDLDVVGKNVLKLSRPIFEAEDEALFENRIMLEADFFPLAYALTEINSALEKFEEIHSADSEKEQP